MHEFFKQYEPAAPRFAVLIFLIFGVLWMIIAAVGLSGVGLAEGAVANSIVQGLASMAAMAVLAARLRAGFAIACGAGAVVVLAPVFLAQVTGTPADYGPDLRLQRGYSIAMGAFWIVLLALTAAWIGRAAFVREFDTGQFPGWVKAGMSELLRKDPYAWARIVAGLAVMFGAGVLAMVLFKAGQSGRGPARAVAAVITVGALLIFSALSLSEGSETPRIRL